MSSCAFSRDDADDADDDGGDMTIKGIMLLVFAVMYFIAPDLIPGPVDDLFVMALAGVGAVVDGRKQ